MNDVLKFIKNPTNNIWIDSGIVIIVLLLAGIIFVLNSNYFHFIASITLIIIGFLLLFWGNINEGLISLYNKALASSSFPNNGKEFLLFLKINLIFHKMLFFSIIFLLCWFFETIFYFAFFKKRFKIYSASKKHLFVNIFSKLFVFGLMLIGVLYLLTPIYIHTIKYRDDITIKKSNSYLQKTFQKLKILNITNRDNNPFKPIWEDLIYFKNLKLSNPSTINVDHFRTRFQKINKFFKTKYFYFYEQKWLNEEIRPGYWMLNFINDIKNPNFELTTEKIDNIQKTIVKIAKNDFIFLPEIK